MAAQPVLFSPLRLPRSTVWHASHIPRLLPVVSDNMSLSSCTVLGMLYKLLFALFSVFVSRRASVVLCKIGREQGLVTQEWTPERAAALITWWNEGICASEIGRRLSITKNAVIGKAFRLQLPKRWPSSPTQSDDQSIIRLERLGGGMCSWPLGATDETGFHFCGSAAVPGKPYCPTHCKLAYLPAARNRKAAAVA